ncbi:unnamed protein product [Heterobilharzia americana]|nr:unnamed protein product [Heterobilharzia americana]
MNFPKIQNMLIYQSVNKLKTFRILGIFCASQGVMWSCLTYDHKLFEPLEDKMNNKLKSVISLPENSWYTNLKKNVREKLYTQQTYPYLTAFAAISMFCAGFLVPRRIVHSISLITTKTNNASKFEKYLEINTYGAFGIRNNGRTFRKSLERIELHGKLYDFDSSHLTLCIKNLPIRFIINISEAEYLDENELHCLIYETTQKKR